MDDYKELIEKLAQYATDCHELLLEASDVIEELSTKRDGKTLGEWKVIWNRDDPNTSSEEKCSVCGRVSKRPLGHYCKWCGAFMIGNTTPPKEKK